MKGAKNILVYERLEIDNQVVNFVTFFANLQSFNQIRILVSTARRNLAGNSSSRRSFALKIDLWRFIMFARALRHWTPTLRSPRRITEATVNIRSCSCSSWKFIGGWTSCLFDALIFSTDISFVRRL